MPSRLARRRQASQGPSSARRVLSRPGVGVVDDEIGMSLGPDALRAPPDRCRPIPPTTRPAPELKALRAEAERRVTSGQRPAAGSSSSSLYEACAWFSTGFGDAHTARRPDRLLRLRLQPRPVARLPAYRSRRVLRRPAVALAPDAESVIVLANPVQPHSEGEIVLEKRGPGRPPDIRMNYYGDPHDLEVMVAVLRKALDVVAHWPGPRPRPDARAAGAGRRARLRRRATRPAMS